MLDTFYEVMLHVRKTVENCWVDNDSCKQDVFEIVDGVIDLPFLHEGQYFIISGSYFNDGIYKYYSGASLDLYDETSTFYVIPVKPPRPFIKLVEDIVEWKDKFGSKANNPFSSESFDGYSYQKATGENGLSVTWKEVFKTRLDQWRML